MLTVSDADTFASIGGIVQVLVENGKMRFRINPRSAKRARLQLSSRLLALAELVEEEVSRPEIAAPLVHLLIAVPPGRVLASSMGGLDWARRVTAWRRD